MTFLTSAEQAVSIPTPLTPYLTTHTQPPNPTLPICISCQAAVLPKSLLEHLRKHHQLPADLRSAVRSFIDSLPGESKGVDFGDVQCGGDGTEPVEGLKVVGAWRCRVRVDGLGGAGEEVNGDGGKECGFIRKDVTDLRRHVNLVHGVGAKGAYEACKAQSWFGGRRAVYWRVEERRDDGDGDVEGEGVGVGDGDVVMSEARNEEEEARHEGGVRLGEKVNEEALNEKDELHAGEEGGELTKRLQTPVFTSLCRWGFYGKGFGDKTPTTWRVKDGKETEIERELRLGKIC
ncbi:hypothetical protein DL98DRAFT_604408 [Cadophora sp. DSE1049]|nr:hypothetical protein DL98DRAFT_604408 [Cadophora sp. DSE1049]